MIQYLYRFITCVVLGLFIFQGADAKQSDAYLDQLVASGNIEKVIGFIKKRHGKGRIIRCEKVISYADKYTNTDIISVVSKIMEDAKIVEASRHQRKSNIFGKHSYMTAALGGGALGLILAPLIGVTIIMVSVPLLLTLC
jgi:hypothetical protein